MRTYLDEIKSEEDLKQLFIEKWNWSSPYISSFYFKFPEEYNVEKQLLLAQKGEVGVIFIAIKNLPEEKERFIRSFEQRLVSLPELKERAESSIFIFSIFNFKFLDFVSAEKIAGRLRIKRFSINPETRGKLRTPAEQLEKLKLEEKDLFEGLIKDKIKEAFSVEAITEKFYKDYIGIFKKIKDTLIKKGNEEIRNSENKLRDYIHKTLSRIMFIYFVQKRGCFGGDKNFLINFWDSYKNEYYGENKFHRDWLNVLFFEGLACPSYKFQEKSYLGKFNKILKESPYLDGGLFSPEGETNENFWLIPDEIFDDIFDFFESYNFTITESTPLEIDIAIDPEMLGNIYEQLVNVEEQEEQAKAGIFYTPKVEIELMLKRALVEFIYNKTKINKEKLYRFIFDKDISFLLKEEIEEILKNLNEILILDPACGSGHYLVVATQLLYELKEKLRLALNKHTDRYEEKKKIIEHNIYGNDIKEWAAEIAKLRLWLDLFIDADEESLKNQFEPLLPQFNFKIRTGDSLIQRFGDKLIPIRNVTSMIKYGGTSLKELQNKKISVYENKEREETAKYWERRVFQDGIRGKIVELQKDIKQKVLELDSLEHPRSLFDDGVRELPFNQERIKKLNEEKQKLERELTNLQELQKKINNQEEMPMIWDLAFAEVFEIKKGFDIIIANPPYVRQEKIEDLNGFYSKNGYKEKLIEQTRMDWSYNYEGKVKNNPSSKFHPIPQKFDRKCDLYVYFYLKGLKLLNPDGVLCYISSNSWLDVGFGRILQEVLIKRCPVVAVYDNQVKRSFKHADVNTIIALIKAPKEKDFDEEVKNNEAKFVMFKKPFEEVMHSEVFIDLEKEYDLKEFQEGKRRENEIYRLHLVNQKDLWEFGKDEKTGQYVGNKWGGKYLRAPEIYWKILEKGKGKLVRLGDIAEVRRGFTTGVNEFFYVEDVTDKINFQEIQSRIKNLGEFKNLEEIKKAGLRIIRNKKTGDYWLIEEEFLKPVVKSLKECKSILIKTEDLKYKVLIVYELKEELKGKKVLDYIEWGEKQGFHKRSTCIARVSKNRDWFNLEDFSGSFVFNVFSGDRYLILYNKFLIPVDHCLYVISFRNEFENIDSTIFVILLNSSYLPMIYEIFGRALTGSLPLLEIMIYEVNKYIFLLDPQQYNFSNKIKNEITRIINRPIKSIFIELGFDPNKPIREQEPNPLPDRKALDDIVFDTLGLTEEERKEVYLAVAELVQNRLKKAKSV